MYFVSFFLFRYRNWCDGQSMPLLLILRVHVQVVYSLLWQLCDMLVFISLCLCYSFFMFMYK